MPEFGALGSLEPIPIGAGPSFMSGAESELDAVYRQRNSVSCSCPEPSKQRTHTHAFRQSYRIRESKTVVYANDGEVATVGTAGDVDPGRAWRKKRPSDMVRPLGLSPARRGTLLTSHRSQNLPNVQSMRSISTSKSSAKPVGQTFVRSKPSCFSHY